VKTSIHFRNECGNRTHNWGQTPSAHQERPGCFPGVFRQPLTPIMGSIPTFIPEMNTGFNLLNKK
ncbi:hypothetical protein ACUOAQ_02840, partial [Escherichia sp. SP-MK]